MRPAQAAFSVCDGVLTECATCDARLRREVGLPHGAADVLALLPPVMSKARVRDCALRGAV